MVFLLFFSLITEIFRGKGLLNFLGTFGKDGGEKLLEISLSLEEPDQWGNGTEDSQDCDNVVFILFSWPFIAFDLIIGSGVEHAPTLLDDYLVQRLILTGLILDSLYNLFGYFIQSILDLQ
jgi:hypothetical protein